jgi:hypothetical protein
MMPLERMRVPQRKVGALLREALQSGAIDHARVTPKLLAELQSST